MITTLKNKISEIFPKKRIFYISLILIVWFGVIFAFSWTNINNPNLWFDESGQFWIAKGLNHYSPPFSPVGSLTQVLKNNARFNLDPGGFSVILHFWSMISNNYIFLRSLPFIFFLIAMIFVSKLCFIWRPKSLLAYFAGFILLSSILLNQYAFELRAYSMEMLAAVVALYFCHKIYNILDDYRYALISGTLLAVLLTSRYSAIIPVFVLGTLILGTLIFKYHKNKNVKNFFIFILPIITSLIFVYLLTFRHQNSTATPPIYVQGLMFKTADLSKVIFHRLTALGQIFLTLLPFLLLTLMYGASVRIESLKNVLKPYRLYFIYTLILNFIFITLSLLGKYPWSVNSKWDISTHVIFVIAWLPLIFICADFIYEKKHFLYKKLQTIFISTFILFFLFIAINFKTTLEDSVYLNYISNNVSPNSKILINYTATPTIKYLFEYGPLKNDKNRNLYKNISSFNNTNDFVPNSITDFKKIDSYDYIILTQFDYNNSELKNVLSQKNNWVDCSIEGPSKMFENKAKIGATS